jgi:heme-degrading monooxygenase HmoA
MAMTVKVIIDRRVKNGKEADFFDLLKELRSKAISSEGYISGETLRAVSDRHNYVVVSTWQSGDDWKKWEKNSERAKIQARIEKIMSRPTKTKLYVHA